MTHHVATWCRALLGALLLLVPLLFAGLPLGARSQAPDFDHLRSGFPLTGQHARERCESCHVGGLLRGTPRDCASCHVAGTRWSRSNTVKPQNHLPTPLACDACHTTLSFTGARFSHVGVARGSCTTCHNGSVTEGKPAGHLVTSASCDSCHRSSAWVPAAGFDHGGVAPGSCATCHNGSRATGKPAQHVPTTASCDGCHRTGGSWKPSTFNHSQGVMVNQCASCHSGSYPPADGRPATHIPYATLTGVVITNCDSCHKAGYAAWTPVRFHAAVSVSTQCATCHTGSYPPAVGKPATSYHVGATVCESCHKSTSSWSAVTFAHNASNAVGTGTCDTCHNGSAARGKTPGHIPVTTGPTKCDSCHKSQASWTTALTMNHGVVAASTCKSCHSGAYVSEGTTGALAKPANHIPETTQLLNGAAMDCNACHKGTTSWTSLAMNHNNSLGGGAGWCKGCHLSGSPYAGAMDKMSLTHEKKTPPAIDCSESGCHRPLGNKGATYTKWD